MFKASKWVFWLLSVVFVCASFALYVVISLATLELESKVMVWILMMIILIDLISAGYSMVKKDYYGKAVKINDIPRGVECRGGKCL